MWKNILISGLVTGAISLFAIPFYNENRELKKSKNLDQDNSPGIRSVRGPITSTNPIKKIINNKEYELGIFREETKNLYEIHIYHAPDLLHHRSTKIYRTIDLNNNYTNLFINGHNVDIMRDKFDLTFLATEHSGSIVPYPINHFTFPFIGIATEYSGLILGDTYTVVGLWDGEKFTQGNVSKLRVEDLILSNRITQGIILSVAGIAGLIIGYLKKDK